MWERGRPIAALFRKTYRQGLVRSRWCTAVAACLCGVLSSCVHYHPQPLAPVTSESSYRSRSLNDSGLAAFVRSVEPSRNAKWPPQTFDLANASLVAAYFNPSIQVARAQVKTAEAGIVSAGGRPNPSLSAAGGYETSPESPLSIRFELSLPIETARKRSYRILEAVKLADAARIGLKEASWHVYSQVRDAWMDHLAATDALTAIRSESQIRVKTVALMEKRVSEGEAARPELDLARVEASRTAVSLRDAEGQVAGTLINLASAMGMPVSALTGVLVSGDYGSPQPLELLSAARVQQKGLLNRLDIQRSLLEYAAAEARLQLEVARQYPDIQLNPGYDFDEGHHKFTFGPAFPVPVWNRNTGPIAEAEAKRSEAEARFLALQSQVIGDMERSLSAYRTAFKEFEEADRQWSTIQAGRERATLRAVQFGEEDQLALNAVRVESVAALHARFAALAKTRAAFSGLEDAVQAPLGKVPWIQPPEDGNREQYRKREQ
jgi:outer membrane protein, heavy metal efflux system